ncbi:iron reductase [Pseudomonas amygdali pv. tabaci str. ATCC 11528]|uniref:siderophore-iron reductase FhuF n=1 Tax=Pseudomonas syringae group TaxID=136849 RepID=UPI000209A091|nr:MULTISPECIES: siderophore-iron reductase FhuF [Pseudomonas syringae group]KEZ65736.1 iron reductase [Pseudomonas amygdali pv. tabaci str. ATCC 11528]KKY52843.1 iron reductase [Pseudomonas amygdali pv. tabaci str. ATCC 11528]MDU8643722.1 siderophore-iron reductase FhuF [Pseudomonas syringae group sp. 26L6]QED85842.1 siderophore-iron reductase FhuF [Pseudomonas amygdali pv. tabaci str. ATCC 11528]
MFQPVLAAYAGAALSAQLFSGPLERFGQTLLAADDSRPDSRPVVALPDLLQTERLDQLLLSIYGPQLMPSQLPVLVSQWAKFYFMQIVPPVLVASLVHGWHWPLALEQVALAVDKRGLPNGVRLAGEGEAWRGIPADPFQRFAGLLDDNLQPFIAALSAYGGLPCAVLWSSAGDYLEGCLVQLATCSTASLVPGLALLSERKMPDGRANPLFQAVRYVAQAQGDEPRRQRRVCCLSHRVEWVGRCEHCPLSG